MNDLQRFLVHYVHYSSELATKLAMISVAFAIIQAVPQIRNQVIDSVEDERIVERVRRLTFYSSGVLIGVSTVACITLAVVNKFNNLEE